VWPQLSVQVVTEVQVHGQLTSAFPQVSVAVPFELQARLMHAAAAVPVWPQLSVQVAADVQMAVYGCPQLSTPTVAPQARPKQELAARPVRPQVSVQLTASEQVAFDLWHPQPLSTFPQVSVELPSELHARPLQAIAAVAVLPQLSTQVDTIMHFAVEAWQPQ